MLRRTMKFTVLITTTAAFHWAPPIVEKYTRHASKDGACDSHRRQLISGLLTASQIGGPPTANALVDLTQPPKSDGYDPARNKIIDLIFSQSMATTMKDYEEEARPYKTRLFQSMFDSLASNKSNEIPVVVEVGMGTFPNSPYLSQSLQTSGLKGLDMIGVDPNDSMKQYAVENAKKSGLLSSSKSVSLKIEHGVAEALPLPDHSADAVISTLTLCSVSDPDLALSEIHRILKPNTGKFVFREHVLSETDSGLALEQQILSPLQTVVADGCHLNRKTGSLIQSFGFRGGVDQTYITMKSADIIGPTVYGIASA